MSFKASDQKAESKVVSVPSDDFTRTSMTKRFFELLIAISFKSAAVITVPCPEHS